MLFFSLFVVFVMALNYDYYEFEWADFFHKRDFFHMKRSGFHVSCLCFYEEKEVICTHRQWVLVELLPFRYRVALNIIEPNSGHSS